MNRALHKTLSLSLTVLLFVSPISMTRTHAATSQSEQTPEIQVETPLEEQDLEERIDTFLSVCGDLEESEYAPSPDYSCTLEAQALTPILEQLEKDQSQIAEQRVEPSCAEHPGVMSAPLIRNFKEDLTEELQCLKEDVEYYEQSCSEEFGCNMIRSGMAASKMFPSVIGSPLRSFLESRAQNASDAKHCLDESRSSCLTEVWTAFIANINDTMSSLWELAKTGWNSLWNISDFFDRKSEELHVAASQKKEDVISFWKSPGEWMYKHFTNFKNSVEEWMKGSVFCQEWEGTPHMPESKCVRPLETFGCINCGDSTNAFCAAAGVITSELGLVVVTAGAGSALAISARLGARAAGKVAIKVGSKIASVAPKMTKLTKTAKVAPAGKVSKVGAKAKIVAESVVEASRVAVRISSEKIAHAKDLVVKYANGAMETKAAKVVLKTIDIASTPMIVLDRAGEMGILASEKIMGKIVPGVGGRYLRKREVIRRLGDSGDDSYSHTRDRLNFTLRHQARGARHVSTYESKKPKKHVTDHPDHISQPGANDHSRLPSEDRSSKGDRQRRLDEQQRQASVNAENSRKEGGPENQREKPRREQAEPTESDHRSSDHKDKKSEGSLARKLVIADAALKASHSHPDKENVNDSVKAEMSRLTAEDAKGVVAKKAEIKSREDAIAALDPKASGDKTLARRMSDREVKEKYNQMRETYSNKNRKRYVRDAIARTGVSSQVAGKYFDKRQEEVESAGELLFPKEEENGKKKKKGLEDLKREVAGIDGNLDSISDKIAQLDKIKNTPKKDLVADSASNTSFDADEDFQDSGISRSGASSAFPVKSSAQSSTTPLGSAQAANNFSATEKTGEPLAVNQSSSQNGNSSTVIDGVAISASETRILEGLINVNALHLIDGEPDEMKDLKSMFGDEVEETISHGKIRSSKGEFMFIKTQTGFIVFKKLHSKWVKVHSRSLDKLLKDKILATRS